MKKEKCAPELPVLAVDKDGNLFASYITKDKLCYSDSYSQTSVY